MKYSYIVSHLTLQHIFLPLMYYEILHTCTQVCALSYPIFKPNKKHVNCLWLYVEDAYVQRLLNIVRQYIL
jgi:hypothetical protein